MDTALLIIGVAGGMTATNVGLSIRNVRSARGYRKAREDDHRGADPEDDPGTVSLQVAGTGEDPGEDPGEDLTPDLLEPIVGLRAWRTNGATLISYQNTYWPFRERMKAACSPGIHAFGIGTRDTHDAPGKACSCGIYAAKREIEIQTPYGMGPWVWGRVALWGRVEESEKGYRAQYAYPIGLTLVNAEHSGVHSTSLTGMVMTSEPTPPLSEEKLEAMRANLAMHYGVPVRIGTTDELQQLRAGNYEAMGIPAEVRELVG